MRALDLLLVTDLTPKEIIFGKLGGVFYNAKEMILLPAAMFVALWWFSNRPRPRYAVSGLFALLYGVFRFVVEFVRVPDAQLGYLAFGWLTMGQVLSLPLIALGLFLLWLSRRSPTLAPAPVAAAPRS